MREIDRRAIEEFGIPSLLLMENAGAAVARRAEEIEAWCDGPIVVLCGKGNNGGDGFVAARRLACRGHRVRCLMTSEPDELKGDARTNYDLAQRLKIPLDLFSPAQGLSEPRLIIDALLGTGFTGQPHGLVAEAITAVDANRSPAPVLAVDVPSGLDATTGQVSKYCINAYETVTFGLLKTGLVQYPGRAFAGTVTVAEIGLPCQLLYHQALDTELTGVDEAATYWPARLPWGHKGDSGRVLCIAGSPGLTGAAAMTAVAALRGGAGLVTVGIPKSLNGTIAVKLTEAMSLPLPETAAGTLGIEALRCIKPRLHNLDALAMGPGLGRDPETGELVRALLRERHLNTIIDADGLNLVAPAGPDTFHPDCVITPHPGEMARLLGTDVANIESDRLGCAREAANRFGCVVVLKGAGTVIAAPDGRVAINPSGSPALATGGTGDVLTGLIASVLAQGCSPYSAALAGVYAHGVAGEIAGERFGAPGAIAGDVIDAIPAAIARVQSRSIEPPYRMI